MRRFVTRCHLAVAASRLAVPWRPCAVAARQPSPSASRRSRRSRAPAAAGRHRRLAACSSRRWRQFQIGGRLTSVDGDPARFQRYQDLRDGVLFTDARYAREDPIGSWLFRVAADNVGWRDQRYFGKLRTHGPFRGLRPVGQIPQFYSVDTQTPYTPASDSPLPLDDATQRAIQNGQATLSAYMPIASQFDLRERRDIGNVQPRRDADAAARRDGGVHDDAARGRVAVGRQLRIQQRRRGGAAVRLAHERLHRRHRVDERPATCCASATTARGSTTSTTRWSGTARSGWTTRRARPAADAWRCGRRIRRRPSAPPATRSSRIARSSRVRLVRILEQRRAAAAVHDQPDAAADRAAAGTTPRPRRMSFRPTSNLVSRPLTIGSSARALRRIRLQQPDRRTTPIPQFINYDTSVKDVVDWRAGAVRAQPHDVRCGRDVERPPAAGADRGLYAQQHRPRLPHLREHGRERARD